MKMTQGFWGTLKKPFFVMAPMADVTDAAFRRLIAKYSNHGKPNGGPDVFYTEFVSCDGLCSKGRDALLTDLKYSEGEHPIVAQIFGSTPDHFRECGALIKELGFDGIDINMGCPDKSVEKQCAGAALIKTPKLARELIAAAKEGSGGLPVSVKTRVGYNKVTLDEWLPEILAEEPAVVTIHARTRKEMSLVPARWEHIARAVEISHEFAKKHGTERTLIVGNGDVKDLNDAKQKAHETGADGVMLGRAIFGNPWLFSDSPREVSVSQRLGVLVEHTHLFEELLGGVKNFAIMKKHYKAYVTGFQGAKELRVKLMDAKNADEVEIITKQFFNS
ncbi:MAG: tRNA-dihydrouridine synthase [Candidatus Yonathbacteria bacterium]|nr:tRNA-dihydrouridine synthase [Candidatus Yonathbacteria bacterium]